MKDMGTALGAAAGSVLMGLLVWVFSAIVVGLWGGIAYNAALWIIK